MLSLPAVCSYLRGGTLLPVRQAEGIAALDKRTLESNGRLSGGKLKLGGPASLQGARPGRDRDLWGRGVDAKLGNAIGGLSARA
eukprot:scaffold83835_cov35-Prasinocladus_malaysianus.AAC.1